VFRNVFLKTLRDYRVGILGWGIGMGMILVFTMASVSQVTATPEARAELVALAGQFAWNAAAVAVDTVGGYAMFKIGVTIFLIVIWPLLAGSRALRGEEERGSMDVLLSLPVGRARVAVQKVAAIWTALLAMGVIIGVLAYLGGQAFKGDFGLLDALSYGIDVALVCVVFAGVALLLSQFTAEAGTAAGWTGGLLVISIVVDMVHRVFPDAETLSRFSPIYYFNLSKPLVPSYGTDAGGMLVLLVLGAVLSAAAIVLFARRDIGATVPLPVRLPSRASSGAALPVRDWSLGSVYARSLATILVPTLWWAALLAGFTAWIIIAVQQIGEQLAKIASQSPVFTQVITTIGGSAGTLNATFMSAMFQLLPVLLMAFVVTQVNGWAADEENGRLDMVLATPQTRTRVVLGRFAALTTSVIFIGVVVMAVTLAVAGGAGVALDQANVVAASLGLIPLGLLIAAIGYLGAGWLRTAADTGLLSFILLFWFFVSFIGRDLDWPEATQRVSAFYYYGNPLLKGLEAANVATLVGGIVIALGVGVWRFARKDIAV
jgi:ABC-2 type transport system permease protein